MKQLILSLVLLIGVATYACAEPTAITADDTQVCWTAPTTNVDGSAISDGAGFKVYWSDVPDGQSNSQRQDVSGWGSSCVQFSAITGLLASQIYFKVTAADTSGNESAWSNEAIRKFSNAGEVPGSANGLTSK